ncbi:unnamed protein product [Kluyveromyces dobzhanskii CBS 2104]|uniref:WGS project CCBQ000000000 data, contig 00106 n=1 Tax=Kluyveromyces dobzhanskii CBS 2104 TaxID=1427455 RepID=A0A0A8L5M4_9SACH|nr:unnamed protein product [Kluyveromyces dobzhanskii CBS 2104]
MRRKCLILSAVLALLHFVAFGLCSSRIAELNSSDQFYNAVLANHKGAKDSTAVSTLLYVFKPGCSYCAELEPKLDFLTSVFPNNETLKFVKVNGQQAAELSRDLNIRSYPQLFILTSIPSQILGDSDFRNAVRDNSYVSQFHGERTIKRLAQWISNNVGEMPHWPQSRLDYGIRILDDFTGTLEKALVDAVFPTGDTVKSSVTVPTCFAFVNSWMDIQYLDMFNGDLNTLILEDLSRRWRDINFHVLDSSLPELSALSSQLQIAHSPTLCFIYRDKIIKAALMPYDYNSRDRELEYFTDIISKCVLSSADDDKICEDFLDTLPLAEYFSPSPVGSEYDENLNSYYEDSSGYEDDYVEFDVYDL